MSKTPQFDKALDEILKDLKPHDRTCKQCGQSFHIYQEDIDFYKIFKVPAPKLCPLCRKRRRFAHLMRVPKFFKRSCQVPGHKEKIITVFPPTSPHKVVDFSYWWSDKWEATDYGVNYDFSQEFFPQFKKLFFSVPIVALDKDPKAVNSDYIVGGLSAKNAYFCAMPLHSEDVAYSYDVRYSKDCLDCNVLLKGELCYEAVNSGKSNRCSFIINCGFCSDSCFLYECKNCSHCFLSSNIRNKKYVFNNQQLTKEEYEKKIEAINLGNRSVLENYKRQFQELIKKALRRAVTNRNVVSSVGNSLMDCRNSFYAFYAQNLDNVRYIDNSPSLKDSMDTANTMGEKIYESIVTIGSNILFSLYNHNNSFLEYCANCFNSHNCFGCVGLKNKEFYIFNQPYQESDYWKTVDRIKTEMLARGEYGEFFPLSLGLLPYQSSNAQIYFPLDENQARELKISWYDEPEINIPADVHLLYAPQDVPSNIKETSDDILNKVIICEKTKRPFRLIDSELNFYRRMNLPIPTKHPWQRLMERFCYERNIWLYPFKCPQCGKESFSVYTPEKQKELKIHCEECYLREVI